MAVNRRAGAKATVTESAETELPEAIKRLEADEDMVVHLIQGQCESLARFTRTARGRFPRFGSDTLRRIADSLDSCALEIAKWKLHRARYRTQDDIALEADEAKRFL